MMNIDIAPAPDAARTRTADKTSREAGNTAGKFDEALSGASSKVQNAEDDQQPAKDAGNSAVDEDGEAVTDPETGAENKLPATRTTLLAAGTDLLKGMVNRGRIAADGEVSVATNGKRTSVTDKVAAKPDAKQSDLAVADKDILDLLKGATEEADVAPPAKDADPVAADGDDVSALVDSVAQQPVQNTGEQDALATLAAAQVLQKSVPDQEKNRDLRIEAEDGAADQTPVAGSRSAAVRGDTRLPDEADVNVNTSGDTTFRISSSRSGANAVDLRIDGAGSKAEFRTSSAGTSGVESVTVLDSRRFIGLAPSSNSTALAGLISSDSEWVSAMQPGAGLSNAAAQSSTGNVVHTLKLQLKPVELGNVTMALRLSGDELVVHLTVETRAAYRQLSDDSRSIVDMLRSQGYTVEQVSVSIASSERGSGAQSGQQQQQGTAGQQLSEGQNQNNGAREGSGGSRHDNGEDMPDETARGAAGISDRADGNSQSGVYL